MQEASAGKAKIYIHKVIVAEVCYNALRIDADESINSFLALLRRLPLNEVDDLSDDFIERVGYFKAHHKISFADAFVLALAQTQNATIVSSDHHEFDTIGKAGILSFFWIR